MNAGGYHNQQLLEAVETDCLEDAMNAIENGATNEYAALDLAKHYGSSEVISYLQEVISEKLAQTDDDYVENAIKKSPRAAKMARKIKK
jgi:hypothetical protein